MDTFIAMKYPSLNVPLLVRRKTYREINFPISLWVRQLGSKSYRELGHSGYGCGSSHKKIPLSAMPGSFTFDKYKQTVRYAPIVTISKNCFIYIAHI